MIPRKTPTLITVILVIIICYFSWIPSPVLSESNLLPKWLSNWADKYYNLRTAVPFLGIGLMGGVSGRYILTTALCFALVLFVEIGQLFIPNRTFDFEDIFYAVLGTLVGISLGYIGMQVKHTIHRKSGT